MAFGIDDKILKSIAAVFARHPLVMEARIYGSRARGDFRTGSDIDIALFAPDLDFSEFLRIRGELDDLPCLYKLDTTHFDTLGNEDLKRSILKDGAAFYRREDTSVVRPEYPVSAGEPLYVREDFPEYGSGDSR